MNDTTVPAILLDYIEGLKTHDVARIAATMAGCGSPWNGGAVDTMR